MDLNDKTNVFPYPRNRKDAVDPPNIVYLLNARQLGTRSKSAHQLKQFAELKATVSEMKETHCQLPPSVRSTFLMSFSHDCTKMASTHGDHNIYVSDVKTGKQIQKLEGHPRTPWSIAFHPTSNDILASGCLAGQVRVWGLHGGSEMWKAENGQVIASVTFHPFLQMLVIAVGNCLYFWDWSQPSPSAYCCTNSEIERIRFVKFDHYGHRLITGISNVNPSCSSNNWPFLSSGNSPLSDQSDNDSLENFRASRRVERRVERSFIDPEAIDSLERTIQGRLVRFVMNPHAELSAWQSSRSESSSNDGFFHDISPEPITIHSDASSSETAETLPTEPSSDSNQGQNEPEPEFFTSGEIWNTFSRIRMTCSDLERRLRRQVSFNRSDEPEPRLPVINSGEHQNSSRVDENNPEDNSSPGHGSEGTAEQEFTANPYTPLLHMLARIRMTLRFSTLSLTAALDRIDQVRARLNELLQMLRYWSGRRPVGHLHRESFEEMIAQLSGQMESLVQADERLANTVTLPERPSSVEQNSHQSVAAATAQNVEETTASEGSYITFPRLTTPAAIQSIQIVTDWPLPNERNVTLGDGPQVAVPSIPGRSVSNASEDNSRSTSSTPSRVQEYFPSHRFNPLSIPRTFRRNLTPQFSASSSTRHIGAPSRRFRQQPDENNVISSAESDDESFVNVGIRPVPRLALASRRRNTVNASVHQEDVGLPAAPAEVEGLFRSGLDIRYDIVSESSDDTDRPSTPPLLLYSPATSLLFNGTARMVINDPQAQNHRIQSWSFSPYKLPAIYDAAANVVARRCVIHNDASVDISQDGEKLVCLIIPPEDADHVNNLMFGVYSLRPEDLGKNLCMWGYVSNAISVSFSPLAQYVIVASTYSRPLFSNPEKAAVAQIIKIQCKNGCYDASYVRSFTQIINNENRFQRVNLNCVRWLPQPGLGIAYATNRGCLCICKPTAGWIFENIDESNFERNTRRNRLRFVRAFMRPL